MKHKIYKKYRRGKKRGGQHYIVGRKRINLKKLFPEKEYIPLSDMPRHPGYEEYGKRKMIDLRKAGTATIGIALATPMTNALLIPAGLAMMRKGRTYVSLTDEHDKPTIIGKVMKK